MNSILEKIDGLITRAKRLRDRERYEAAVEALEKEAIPLIEEGLASAAATEERFELGRRLADGYGLQGGCYRRWGLQAEEPQTRARLLLESVRKYQKGQEVEANGEYGIVSTYNLLNRIVSQVLLDPRYLSDPMAATDHPELESLNAKDDLERVEKVIESQLHRDDSWLLADKALVNLLLDRNDPAPEVVYNQFLNEKKIHPYFVYESMLSTLRPLAQLELPIAGKLREVVRLLDARLAQLTQQ